MSDEQNANVATSNEAGQENAKVESQPTNQPDGSGDEDVSIEQDAAKIAENLKGLPEGKESEPEDTEEVPFHNHPRWKEVTEKLSKAEQRALQNEQAANYWQAFNQYAAEKPEAAIEYLEYLEGRKMVAEGTVERAKKEMGITESEPQAQEQSGQPVDIQSQVKEVLKSDPTYQSVEQQRLAQEAETERMFQEFEQNHPDVPEAAAQDPNVRRRIFLEAQQSVQKGKPMNEALEDAYNWVMKRDELLARARETGEVEGLTSGIQQGLATGASDTGTSRSTSSVRLTAQEKEFARMFNMSEEEYARYRDNPQGALSEDMNT